MPDFELFYKKRCPNTSGYTTTGILFEDTGEIAYNLETLNGLSKKIIGFFSEDKRDEKISKNLVKIINEEVTHAILNKMKPELTPKTHHILMWLLNNCERRIKDDPYPQKGGKDISGHPMFSEEGIKRLKGKLKNY